MYIGWSVWVRLHIDGIGKPLLLIFNFSFTEATKISHHKELEKAMYTGQSLFVEGGSLSSLLRLGPVGVVEG